MEGDLQLVVDSMPAAVALCSRDLKCIWVNRRCAEWLGMQPEDIAGRPLGELIGEESLADIRPFIERALAGEHVEFERLVRYPGLGERWLRHQLAPARDGSSWIAVLSQADRRKEEFLATMAHELRNPLAPIRNAVAILGKKGPLDPELTWSRDVIDRQVDQLSRLIDDLLDIARIASGKLAIQKERIALERAIDMALETSRPNINAAGHRLSVLLPSERVTVEGDAARLAQVFSNLLNNAARCTEAGGEIALNAEIHEREVRVSIEHSGSGFPPDAGIALSLVHGIVALHGGAVEARNAGPGGGSEFIVRLPLPSFSGAAQERQAALGRAAAAPPGTRVLVADDNRDAADSLQRILALYGYEVKVAHGGAEAIAASQSFRPQVAVLDIDMPGKTGYDVARELREKLGGGVKLVALTGWGQEVDRRRAMEAGFDFHLTKPVDPGVLNDLLAQAAAK